MFNLGLFELTLLLVIALVVLGPDKLPEAARTVGKWYALLKNTKDRLQNDLANELHVLETQAAIQEELAKIRQSENELKAQVQSLTQSLQQAAATQTTTPMTGQFFLLSEYDRQKRLPAAPWLPNTQADLFIAQADPTSHL